MTTTTTTRCECCFGSTTTNTSLCSFCTMTKPVDYDTNKEAANVLIRFIRTGWIDASILSDPKTQDYLRYHSYKSFDFGENLHMPCKCCHGKTPTSALDFNPNTDISICRNCREIYDINARDYLTSNLECHSYLAISCFALTAFVVQSHLDKLPTLVLAEQNKRFLKQRFMDKHCVQLYFVSHDDRLVIQYKLRSDRHFRKLWELLGGEQGKFNETLVRSCDHCVTPSERDSFMSERAKEWLHHFPKCGIAHANMTRLLMAIYSMPYTKGSVSTKDIEHYSMPELEEAYSNDDIVKYATRIRKHFNDELCRVAELDGIEFDTEDDDSVKYGHFSITPTAPEGVGEFALRCRLFENFFSTTWCVNLDDLTDERTLSSKERAIRHICRQWKTDIEPLLRKFKTWQEQMKQAIQ